MSRQRRTPIRDSFVQRPPVYGSGAVRSDIKFYQDIKISSFSRWHTGGARKGDAKPKNSKNSNELAQRQAAFCGNVVDGKSQLQATNDGGYFKSTARNPGRAIEDASGRTGWC